MRLQTRAERHSRVDRQPTWWALTPDCSVVYVDMDQRHLIPTGVQRLVEEREPEFTARVNGLHYAKVYRLPRGIPIVEPGQAPLLLPADEDPGDEGGDVDE